MLFFSVLGILLVSTQSQNKNKKMNYALFISKLNRRNVHLFLLLETYLFLKYYVNEEIRQNFGNLKCLFIYLLICEYTKMLIS